MRGLELSPDGRVLMGQDTLGAFSGAERKRFDAVMSATRLQGVAFAVRFHLHPEVDAEIDMGGAAVSLGLRSGEIWVFRHDGTASLSAGTFGLSGKGPAEAACDKTDRPFGPCGGLCLRSRLDLGESTGYAAGHP
jgi:uncharacterized heparinase superfamily protein